MFSKQALRRLILPLIIEQFLAVMVGMADIMMVSSAGEAAVSSVALVDLINVLIINIFAALATGGAVVCAQSIGAQNLERANRAANQLLYIVTAAALGIMVLVLFCKAGLLGLLFGQVEPEVMEGAVTYFVISALSYPFIAVYNGCAALLRAMGNSKASMCVSAYMNGQNIAGNAVFVFVFHQGVAGVALSSLLSRIAAAGLMLALLHGRRNPVRVSGLLRFRFEPAVMAQILRIGVPNSLENSFFQLGRVLLVSLISTFGTAQTAANAVANNIDNFGVIPGQALGLALITVVGQCVGAGDWDQVRAYTKRLVKLTYLCTWGLNAALLLGLPLILRLYSLTPETQWYAAVLIFIHNGCAMLFWPLAFTMPNALRAAGDVRVPMVISITSMLVVRVGGQLSAGPPLRPGRHRRVAGHGGGLGRSAHLLRAPRPKKAVAGAPLNTRTRSHSGARFLYQRPSAYCMPRLTAVMAAQQHKPIRMGLPPVLTSLIRSVLSPMAAMAMMMKNLDSSLKGAKAAASTPARDAPVVIREASMKNSRKKGNTRRREKLPSPAPPARLARAVRRRASARVMGMMARVRVSLTMVAVSRVLAPGCIPSQAAAAAVTEEVSFTAVPAKSPKPSFPRPSRPPRVGNRRAAATLNRKMTEMDWAISSSSAPMTGAVAAMAEPPQTDEPTPTRVEMLEGICSSLCRRKDTTREVVMVDRMMGRD